MQETQVPSLSQEDPLEKEMATHSRILAWRIPWTEESGRLQSMGSKIVVQDETHTLFRFLPSKVAPHFLRSSDEQAGGLPVGG